MQGCLQGVLAWARNLVKAEMKPMSMAEHMKHMLEPMDVDDFKVDFPQGERTWEDPWNRMVHIEDLTSMNYCQASGKSKACKDKRRCIACAAQDASEGMPEFGKNVDELIKAFEAQGHEAQQKYRNGMEPMEMIKWIAVHLADKPVLRKDISRWGAVRILKDQALKALYGGESLNNFVIYPVVPDNKIHYILYKDAGNYVYAKWLKQLNIEEVNHMNQENMGDLVEAMLAMGFYYDCQTPEGKDRNKILMEVALYVENGVISWLYSDQPKKEEGQDDMKDDNGNNNDNKDAGEQKEEENAGGGDKRTHDMVQLSGMVANLGVMMEEQQNAVVNMCLLTRAVAADIKTVGAKIFEMDQVLQEIKGSNKKALTDGNPADDPLVKELVERVKELEKNKKDAEPDRVGPELKEYFEREDLKIRDDWKATGPTTKPVDTKAYMSVLPKVVEKGYELDERQKGIQARVYQTVRSNAEADKESKGWMDFSYLLDVMNKREVYGELDEKNLWEVVMGTMDYKNRNYSSYMVMWYGDRHAMVRIRYRPTEKAQGYQQPFQQKKRQWQNFQHQ